MTDQLPRQIPQDPAEQERLMPEWVKVEVCRLWCEVYHSRYCKPQDIGPRNGIFAHALTIWQWMPEPVDPDEAIAQEFMNWDDTTINIIRAAIKRGRELEREAGK